MTICATLALLTLLLAAPAGATTLPSGFQEQTLVAGLTQPTAVAWTPDGRMLITEKPGRLKVAAAGASTATTATARR